MSLRYLQAVLAGPTIAISLLGAGSVHAEMDATVRQALQLTDAKQGPQAYALLEPLEVARAGDPDFDTVFGIAAIEAGQFTRAIMALERVLIVQPDNGRAKAELARALFAVGDRKAARALLQETRAQNVPVAVAATIDQFLQAIDRVEAEGKSSWRGYVEAGAGRDTNANSGPATSNVAVPAFGNAVLTLNPSGVKAKANFATLGAGLSGRWVMSDPRWSLIGNGSAVTRMNTGQADQFDTLQADVNGGVSYRVDRHEFTLVGQVGTYGIDGSRARDQFGLVGEWTYRIDNFRQVSSYLQASRLKYPNQGIRDADRTVIGSSYSHLFRNGVLAYGGGYVGQEDPRAAGVPHLGHDLWGVRLGTQVPVAQTVAAFATIGYENRRFGGPDPLFLIRREDRQTNLNIGLNWVPAPTWRITPQIAYTRTQSNVAIADYDKTVVSVTARKDF